MANQTRSDPPFSRERLNDAIKIKGYKNIDIFCKCFYIGRSARQVWRYYEKGTMPEDILDNIGKALDVEVDYLRGKYDEESITKKSLVEYLGEDFKDYLLDPNRHPYNRQKDPLVIFNQFYDTLFEAYDISDKELSALDDRTRLQMMKDIDSAITDILSRYYEGYYNLVIGTMLSTLSNMQSRYNINVFHPSNSDNTEPMEQLLEDSRERLSALMQEE